MMNQQVQSRPGVMLQVFGQGVLLQGNSGIGKSDLALELVDKGHRLIADDAVEFVLENDCLLGRCRAGFDGFLEVHGLGVVSLARLYGEQAVLGQASLDLVLLLENTAADDYDRLQPVQQPWSMLGVVVPAWSIPCLGRHNLALIVETTVRLNLYQQQGYDAGNDLQSRLSCLLKEDAA